MSDYVKMLLSDIILAALLFVGLLFLWLGQLLAGTMDDPDVGNGLWSFGMLFATWALIIGGVLRHDLEKWVRFAMIAAGTLLIIFVGFWPHGLISIGIPNLPGIT